MRAAEREYLRLLLWGKSGRHLDPPGTGTRIEMFEEFCNEEEAAKSGWKQKKYGKPKAAGPAKPKGPRRSAKKKDKAVEKKDKSFTNDEMNELFM